MDNAEKIIKITGSGWSAKFSKDKRQGSLKLTNKCLTFGASGETILLEDIENVEIETRTANVPRIKISFESRDQVKRIEYIDFARHTAGHTLHILIGDSGLSHSEVSSYTAYWASLITMANFMFGNKAPNKEVIELKPDGKRPIGWGKNISSIK